MLATWNFQSPADADEFPTKVTGMMTDHAPDQYSLSDGFEDWRLFVVGAFMGKRLCSLCHRLSSCQSYLMSVIKSLPLLGVWRNGACSLMRKRQREMLAAHEDIVIRLGQAEYEALPDSESVLFDLFIHAVATCTKN